MSHQAHAGRDHGEVLFEAASSPILHVLILVVLGVAILFPCLGQERIIVGREIRHAEIAREMNATGQYIVPHLLGVHYTMKPPLFNWMVAATYKLTGVVSLLTARIPSTLSAIALALIVYGLGRLWYGAPAGMWAALIWLTMPMIYVEARVARMDMMMAALIGGAVYLAAMAARDTRPWKYWCLACLLLSAAILSKGPQAVFFFAAMAAPIWRVHSGKWLPRPSLLLAGLALSCAPPLLWALLCEWHTPGYIGEMISYQFGESLAIRSKRPTLYLEHLLLRTLPWSLLAPVATYAAWRRFRMGMKLTEVPLIALLATVLIMSLFPNKRPHYLLPILPMWALFLGAFVNSLSCEPVKDRCANNEEAGPLQVTPRLSRAIILFGWVILAVAGLAGTIWLVWRAPVGKYLVSAFGAATTAAAIFAVRAALCYRWRAALQGLGAAALTVAIAWMPTRCLFTDLDGALAQTRAAVRNLADKVPIAHYRTGSEILSFELKGRLLHLLDQKSLCAFLASTGPRYLVVQSSAIDDAQRVAGGGLKLLHGWQAEHGRRLFLLVK